MLLGKRCEEELSMLQVEMINVLAYWKNRLEQLTTYLDDNLCMRKTISRGGLTLDELQTATTEVEMIVNSRPLTYISMDSIQEAVTPSHLMTGRRLMSLPDGPYNEENCTCRMPDRKDVPMVECFGCSSWFHFASRS